MSARDDFITNQIDQAQKGGLSPQEADTKITQAVSAYDAQNTPQAKAPWLNTASQIGGQFVGGLLGGVGGALAGAAIPGADLTGVPEAIGGYTGAVGGAGIGTGVGNAVADTIRSKVLNDKTIDPSQTIPTSVNAGKFGAATEAIGIPAAKGLGYLAHPIVPFISMVDKKLASSKAVIDISKLLQNYEETVLPKLRQKGFGQEATDAFTRLRVNITDAVNAFKDHMPAENPPPVTSSGSIVGKPNLNILDNGTVGKVNTNILDNGTVGKPTDISSMELPISQTNQLKRNITGNVNDYYGFDTGKPNIEAVKQFGSLLRQEIAKVEPTVEHFPVYPGGKPALPFGPNQVASTLYKVPETLGGLGKILSLGNPQASKAIGTVEKLLPVIPQKLFPQGGGAWNQLLPAIMQLGGPHQ